MSRVNTFADGFGTWHAEVPRTYRQPRRAAQRAIRAALLERYNDVDPYIWTRITRAPLHDSEGYVVYAEAMRQECD